MVGIHNTDAKTLAYINLYGILGALENLCQLDDEAARMIDGKNVRIGFAVKNGPYATLVFEDGYCRMEQGIEHCDVLLPFSSPEKFNGLIDGTVTPIPTKGFTKIGFLLKEFMRLTDLLSKYLRPTEEDLRVPEFFEKSTKLMFYVIVSAISQIGNHDAIGQVSAGYMVDGIIQLSIQDGPTAGIWVKNHKLKTVKRTPKKPMAKMEFDSIQTARDLFDGQVNALACIGEGVVRMHGMISMLDNMNRILDRVGLYLAD